MNSGSSAFMRSGSQCVRLAVDDGVVPAVARHLHVDRGAGVAHDQHGLDRVRAGQLQRGVDVGLERHLLAAAQAFVGGDDQLAARSRATRSAIDCGAKPPNTTEWIAPMRAQASIATTASGIIGR